MRCAAFRGIDKSEFIDRAPEFDDLTVLEALDALDLFLRRNLRSGAAFGDGLRRQNIDEYHRGALRELLVNAIAHANYASTGTPISIQLFADRLEVISPGRFPPGTTVQSFKEGMSKIRNRGYRRCPAPSRHHGDLGQRLQPHPALLRRGLSRADLAGDRRIGQGHPAGPPPLRDRRSLTMEAPETATAATSPP